MILNHLDPRQSIHNVYELPIIEQSIKYLHACAGFWAHNKGNMDQIHRVSKLHNGEISVFSIRFGLSKFGTLGLGYRYDSRTKDSGFSYNQRI